MMIKKLMIENKKQKAKMKIIKIILIGKRKNQQRKSKLFKEIQRL